MDLDQRLALLTALRIVGVERIDELHRPSLRFELCGMITASHPVPAFRQSRSTANHKPCGKPSAAVSSWLEARAGTCSSAKITLRC